MIVAIIIIGVILLGLVGPAVVIGGSKRTEAEEWQDREREAAYWRERRERGEG